MTGLHTTTRQLAGGFCFLEGPRWHHGRLYVSDFYTHRVVAVDIRGGVEEICVVPQQPSGLGFAPDGSLLVVSMIDRRLLRLAGQRLVEVADLNAVASFHCNDMLVDAAGRAYIGNFGWDAMVDPRLHLTNLALVTPDGQVRVAAPDMLSPNGMALTADNRLLVAETFAGRVTVFDVAADGTLSNRGTWADLMRQRYDTLPEVIASGQPMPDGIALDAEGALWIGDAGGRAALRIAEGGRILARVPSGDLSTFAVALGGDDGRTLFMCASPPFLSHDPRAERRSVLLTRRVDVPAASFH